MARAPGEGTAGVRSCDVIPAEPPVLVRLRQKTSKICADIAGFSNEANFIKNYFEKQGLCDILFPRQNE
jgi:hypothetical protein